ncbi:MAG TPA: COX15/CtaA family protein [Gemmataceae bacterium]|jgi:cytochrome c oxidase assembly protein subunit 15|nr:COX15/CtaA family protein [Gemmataceae bacterium]
MMSSGSGSPTIGWNRWLHYWAVLTVCATFPLLLLGAEVTTKQVGMVDPQGFRLPWHLATVQGLWERGLGYVIEHSHRLAGWVVGTCVIVLAAGLWLRESRRWVRWVGVAALAGVVAQGLLGGFRVQLNALFNMGPNLALMHGCFAEVVFAVLVSLALFTSRSWAAPVEPLTPQESLPLRRWSLLTAGLAYVQVVFGAVVRRSELPLGPRLHLLFAFVVVAAVVWLAKLAFESTDWSARNAVLLLAGLVALQLFLGVEAWLAKFPALAEFPQLKPLTSQPQLIRSLHYLMGSAVFATAVAVVLQAHRRVVWASKPSVAPVGRLEGAV